MLYRVFDDKQDIFRAVVEDWLVSRHPAAREAAGAPGLPAERLLELCRLMVIQPWAEMADAPMGSEFLGTCERVDPALDAKHRKEFLRCATSVLGDAASAAVFLLALDGQLSDEPSPRVLEQRAKLLVSRFAPAATAKGRRP